MSAYAAVGETDSYFSSRRDAAFWLDLPENAKTSALERASRILDESFDWVGEPAEEGQPLRWPRKNAFDLDGVPLNPAAVPDRIRIAAMELAMFLTDPSGLRSGVFSGSGIKSASAGGMSLSFESRIPERFPVSSVRSIVRGLGTFRASSGVPAKCGQIVRG